jgi:hypothetical protein
MQSVPITTNVESSNSTLAIQHYVIKFLSDCDRSVVSSINKTDRHDITDITLTQTLIHADERKITLIFISHNNPSPPKKKGRKDASNLGPDFRQATYMVLLNFSRHIKTENHIYIRNGRHHQLLVLIY